MLLNIIYDALYIPRYVIHVILIICLEKTPQLKWIADLMDLLNIIGEYWREKIGLLNIKERLYSINHYWNSAK